ncbi:uncharacterized protein G2W53_007021 [Senna tora]|uniref:Uncharacterized protein n=1 Tax=Senna tora TaxID=362788 RepID=A0A834X5P2_9FABA|nr:uncharacterized protein G2W53_007021 [Senna tora]
MTRSRTNRRHHGAPLSRPLYLLLRENSGGA